ncbi:hypothetical protein Tco_0055849, partial [Tanacetum coccineum]
RKPKRKDTEIPQSSGPTEPIADEAANEKNIPTHSMIHYSVFEVENEGLGDQEDASKQGRKINDIDKDVEVTLVDETQGRYGDDLVFDTTILDGEEVFVAEQSEKVVKEVVSTTEVSAAATITT